MQYQAYQLGDLGGDRGRVSAYLWPTKYFDGKQNKSSDIIAVLESYQSHSCSRLQQILSHRYTYSLRQCHTLCILVASVNTLRTLINI